MSEPPSAMISTSCTTTDQAQVAASKFLPHGLARLSDKCEFG